MSYEEFLQEKKLKQQAFIDTVDNKLRKDVEELQRPEGISVHATVEYGLDHYVKPKKPEALYRIDAVDVITYIFAVIFLLLPLIIADFEVGYIFGVALLMTVLTRSILARMAAVVFTVIYFLLFILAGIYFDLTDVLNFIFGINSITLVPVIIGSLMAIVAMGSGLIHGLSGSTRYAGVWLIALALVITVADTLVAVFFLGITDWYMIFSLHLAIYIVALVISWGMFYIAAKLVRYGILTALR